MLTVPRGFFPLTWHFRMTALVGGASLPVDAVGIDLEQDGDVVPGTAGDLRRGHPRARRTDGPAACLGPDLILRQEDQINNDTERIAVSPIGQLPPHGKGNGKLPDSACPCQRHNRSLETLTSGAPRRQRRRVTR
jgi:hypothetical protein